MAEIMDGLPSNSWHHVSGSSNPADCVSWGLYPAELANHIMWWEGPSWLRLLLKNWPSTPELVDCPQPEEEKLSLPETTLVAVSDLSLLDRISSYSCL